METSIYNQMNKTKNNQNKGGSDNYLMFYHSVHKDEVDVSICCNERWELPHYLKKPLKENGHSQKYQTDVKRCHF